MAIIFSNNAKKDEQRLKHVLIQDKHFNPDRIKQVIKSDIYHLLKNYADISPENIFVDIQITQTGSYHLKIDGIASNLKIFGSLPDDYD